jgi:hypothetical protein
MKNRTWKPRLIELLLIFAILLTLAAPVLKVIFGHSEREWEHKILTQMGISAELVWLLSAVVAVAFVVFRVYRTVRKK